MKLAILRTITVASRSRIALLLTSLTLSIGLAAPTAQAASTPVVLDITPTITNVVAVNGQILASGIAISVAKGTIVKSVPFSGVPIRIGLAPDQTAAGGCALVQMQLDPIQTSVYTASIRTGPIRFTATAYEGDTLVNETLCAIGNLLQGGLTMPQILAGQSVVDPVTGAILIQSINGSQYNLLLATLGAMFNSALDDLTRATLQSVVANAGPPATITVGFALAPVANIHALGVVMNRDGGNGGPMTLDAKVPSASGLLSNLLRLLAASKSTPGGITLQQILSLFPNIVVL
jgi:hypothetical protein